MNYNEFNMYRQYIKKEDNMKKKLLVLLFAFVASLALFACDKTEETPDPDPTPIVDTIAPAFLGLVEGKLEAIEHLKGVEVDLLEGVKARDNVDGDNVTITIIDRGGYEVGKVGKFTLTYQAADTALNKATVTREITVIDTLDVTLGAVVIGDDFFEYSLNDERAFTLAPDSTAFFRTQDLVHVMDVDFFKAQIELNKDKYDADGVPLLPYGSMALVNPEGKVVYARFSAGATMEIDDKGVITSKDLEWGAKLGAAGSLLFGLEPKMDELLPDGGKIMFIASVGDGTTGQQSRKFLHRNLFSSEYVGGVMYGPSQDIDIETVVVEFIAEHRVVIAKPAPLETPVISINRHILSWDKVDHAKGYVAYVDGVAIDPEFVVGREVKLLDAITELTADGKDPYQITVQAITSDLFKYSDSLLSNALPYTRVEIIAMETPVVTVVEDKLTWGALVGVDTYELYLEYAGVSKVIGTTKDLTFDVLAASDGHGGNNYYFVKGIGSNDYSDSDISNKVLMRKEHVTKELEVAGMRTTVAVVTAENYFTRRNSGDETKLDNMLYMVTGVHEYKGNMTEAFSTVSLLDKDMKFKFVRNILAKQTYTTEKGWFVDDVYAANNAQLVKLSEYTAAGDSLLIGKNGLNVTFTLVGQTETKTTAARDFLAFIAIKAKGEVTATAGQGWRDPIETFMVSNDVVLVFE